MTGQLRVRVVPLVTTRALAGPLDYALPPGSDPLPVGTVVRVPLAGRKLRGVVVPPDGAPAHEGELAVVEAVEPRTIAPSLVDLALWIASYYGSTPARALALVLPPTTRPASTTVVFAVPGAEPGSKRREAILAELAAGPLPLPELVRRAGTTPATVRKLAGDGLVRIEERLHRPPAPAPAHPPLPSRDQAAAIEQIEALLEQGSGELLLHGVTGSGKTEVYLAAIASALRRGRGALVLVPEIALTPQTAGRIAARFGERVAVLHSALGDGERAAAHARIRAGEADVVVGPRSAVFAPLPNLGLVVIDEEHDASYKQQDDPRYDARRVAAKRARNEGAVLLLGSATPRPESWNGLARATLHERIGGPLPPVRVVDLRRDGLYPLSRPLRDALAALAEQGGRGILFLNRRGASPAIHCRTCGQRFGCPRCDVSLSLHGDRTLRCHHCGHTERRPARCPTCGAVDLVQLGAGTERVAEAVEEVVGDGLLVLRLDAEAVSRKGSLDETLERFASARAAVLVGTQLVAKGHDFRDLRLAAAIDADQGLAWPDFRSDERTFALLTQLAGRSGRLGDPGKVIVQAWQPDAAAVELAARHAVEEFEELELARRRLLGYPPFRHLVRVEVAAPDPRPAGRARGPERRRGAAARRGRRPRAGAALPGPRPPPGPAAVQDRAAVTGGRGARRPGGPPGPGAAQGRRLGGGRRRPAVATCRARAAPAPAPGSSAR